MSKGQLFTLTCNCRLVLLLMAVAATLGGSLFLTGDTAAAPSLAFESFYPTLGGEINTTFVQNPGGCGPFERFCLNREGSGENYCLKARVRLRKSLVPADRVLVSLPVGEEIVAADDIYGGTDRLLSRVVPRSGVTVK